MQTPSGQSSSGSAERQGALWGARAEAWAEHEVQGTPIFEELLSATRVGYRTRLLDLGCATGTLCRMAADLGARVAGVDAAEALLEIARRRVPEGDFRCADIQFLPLDDGTFDVVTAVNSLQFAADAVGTLQEARRVGVDGAVVAVALWGPPESVDLFTVVRAVASLAPAPPPARPLLEPGAVEAAMSEAGLVLRESRAGETAFVSADTDEMLRQMTSAGGTVAVARQVGEHAVRESLQEAMEPFRTPEGGYRLVNAWRLLVATS